MADPWIREVGDGIFAYVQPDGSWWINNTGFLVCPDGVTTIDTCATERRTRAYLDAIASVSRAPVRTVVNTHHHGDHTHGNGYFPGATIVSHEGTREGVLTSFPVAVYAAIFEAPDWGEVRATPPFLTYTDRVTLYSGQSRCEISYVGRPAHTAADSIVWVPGSGVLFAGDLVFSGGTPFVLMGSVTGALAVLEDLKALQPRVIIPGHGDPCGVDGIDATIGYLRFVLDAARGARAAGLGPLDAAREVDLGPYRDWLDSERLVGNLHRAYADLGAGESSTVDIVAAFADMVALNGGRPLPCHA